MGPIQILEDFAGLTPELVETNEQSVSGFGTAKAVTPSIHYIQNGRRVVLRIDKKYRVPILVEIDGKPSTNFEEVFFDVMVVDGQPKKIEESWVIYEPVGDEWKQ